MSYPKAVENGTISTSRFELEKQVAKISSLRGSGRTHRACERVARMVAQSNDGDILLWRIPVFMWTKHIVPMLERILYDVAGYEIENKNSYSRTIYIHAGSRVVRLIFVVPSQDFHGIAGIERGRWVFDEGECFDYEYLDWLRLMSDTEPIARNVAGVIP